MKLSLGSAASWLLVLLTNVCGTHVWAADAPAKTAATAPSKNKDSSTVKKAPTPAAAPRSDQLVLDSTVVTGNRELPKVMYIVPWKKADLSDLPGQPFNTLVDETLAPVDREVFRRELEYYQVIADKDRPSIDQADRQATPAADRK